MGFAATAACISALVLTGCLSAGNLVDYRGTGVTRCYRLEYERLWPTVLESVRWAGLVIENANEDNGVILSRSYELEVEDPEDMALEADQGEAVAVFFGQQGCSGRSMRDGVGAAVQLLTVLDRSRADELRIGYLDLPGNHVEARIWI